MRFDGKALFCTGAGSGIAAAVARRFAAEGGRVAVVDIDGETASAVASEIPSALPIACDISDEAAVRDAVGRTVAELGRLDCVYNGAGNLTTGDTVGFAAADFMRMLEVHALGTFLVCREAIPHLRAAGGGSIVNTSSVMALVARATLGPYSAAKGAVHAYTRQLAIEVAPEIRVNSVAPGRTVTGMTEWIYRELGDGDLEAGMKAAGAEVMLGRVARPEEIAAAVCFLLSDDASYVTRTALWRTAASRRTSRARPSCSASRPSCAPWSGTRWAEFDLSRPRLPSPAARSAPKACSAGSPRRADARWNTAT